MDNVNQRIYRKPSVTGLSTCKCLHVWHGSHYMILYVYTREICVIYKAIIGTYAHREMHIHPSIYPSIHPSSPSVHPSLRPSVRRSVRACVRACADTIMPQLCRLTVDMHIYMWYILQCTPTEPPKQMLP